MGVRPARASDHESFVRLFRALETGDEPADETVWARELAPQSVVYERDGSVVGYCYLQLLDGLGAVRHIAVDARHRGGGIGRALMQDAATRLRGRGIGRWCLNVKPENTPAIALYTSLGMVQQHASVAMRMGWDIVDRLPSSPAVRVETLLDSDDAEAEAALGLASGLLAQQRGQLGARLLVAREAADLVGGAVFRPDFPGAYPFRARDAGVARALLIAMQPDADPAKAFMQLVFEDDAELADAFAAAGAARHMEFVMLAGDVPTIEGA